jgi:hypothetical protein
MAEATGGRDAIQPSPAGLGPSLLVTGLVDNPGEIDLARVYARAEFRTSEGHEFRGTPISFSATVLRSAENPAAAMRFVEFLVSPAGLEIVQDFHFISSPILAGGSVEEVPASLAARVQGGYVSW